MASDTLQDWPLTLIRIGGEGEGARGVVAAAALAKKTTVLQVSEDRIVTFDTAWAAVSHFIPDDCKEDDEAVFGVFILVARFLDVRPTFAQWARMLPGASDFELLPVEWTDEELKLLRDTEIMNEANAKRSDMEGKFAKVGAKIREHGSADALLAELTLPTFKWACYCASTRFMLRGDRIDSLFASFGASSSATSSLHVLVPGGDMFNHDASDPDGAAMIDWAPPRGSKKMMFSVQTSRAYAAGEEVRISYGDRTGRDLLCTYGFLPRYGSNCSEGVTLDIRSVIDAAFKSTAPHISSRAARVVKCADTRLREARAKWFEEAGCTDALELSAGFRGRTLIDIADFDGLDTDELRALRILVLDADDLASCSIKSPAAFGRPLTRSNELRVLQLIRALIVDVAATEHAAGLHCRFTNRPLPQIPHITAFVLGTARAQATLLQTLASEEASHAAELRQLEKGAASLPLSRAICAADYRHIRAEVLARHLVHVARMLEVAGEDKVRASAELLVTCEYALECQRPWSTRLLEGLKTVETRAYALPPEMCNKPIALIESPEGGGFAKFGLASGRFVGTVTFATSKVYTTRGEWEADAAAHCVSATASPEDFGWVEGSLKHGWVVAAVQKVMDTDAVDMCLTEMQRFYRSIFILPR